VTRAQKIVVGVALAAKAAALCAFSIAEVRQRSLTTDFAIFYQAVYLISHGTLDPYSTVTNYPFVADHFALGMWLLAPLVGVWHSPLALKFAGDAFILAGDATALVWICRLLADRPSPNPRVAGVLLALGIVATVLNPWPYYDAAFDFHFTSFAGWALVSSGFAYYLGRDALAALCGLAALLAGEVSATLLVGLSLGFVLARPRAFAVPLLLTAFALGDIVLVHRLHVDVGSHTGTLYGYLAPGVPAPSALQILGGVVRDPATAFGAVWQARLRGYANVAPQGLLGLFSPWAAGVWAVLLLENLLPRGEQMPFSFPGFQFAPGYALLAVGEIWFLCVAVRSERLRVGLAALSLANALLWGSIWIPQAAFAFLRSTPEADAKLDVVAAVVPAGAPLIASQGVVGSFAARLHVVPFTTSGRYPLWPGDNYLLFVPYTGVEYPAEDASRAIGCLERDPRATVLLASNELWLFRVRAGGASDIDLGTCRPAAAVAFATNNGARLLDPGDARLVVGPASDSGYVLRSAYFRRPSGSYRFDLELQSAPAARIEVWDFVSGKTLAIAQAGDSRQEQTARVGIRFRATSARALLFSGIGPFVAPPIVNDDDGVLELRVWTPPSARARVDSIDLFDLGNEP
jgi:hypothetical protein